MAGYSKDFEKGFNDILKRQYNERRVKANVVYQQYIADKEHVHMNSTVWVTLTSYVKHLERTKKCIVEDTEKGWYVFLEQLRFTFLLSLQVHNMG